MTTTLPLADTDALLEDLLEAHGPGLRLWAPPFVALDRGEMPSVAVGTTGRTGELTRLRLERRAFVVAVDVERGQPRVVRGRVRETSSPKLLPPPGFEGGLGPAPSPRAAQVVRLEMWDQGAAWPAGTYALVAVAADRTSTRVETVVGRSTSTVDPAAEGLAPEALRAWPAPDPTGNLPHYRQLPESPPVPTEPGITLVAPRRSNAGTAVVHASFCARLRPQWVVPYGALVPITLVLTGSEDPAPILLALRVPTFDRADPANPAATITGWFALDLMQLAPLAAAPQTWFLRAFSSDASVGPWPIAVTADGKETP